MKKFLMFDILITPWIIRVIYWILQVVIIIFGIFMIFNNNFEIIMEYYYLLNMIGPFAYFGWFGFIIIGSIYLRLVFELIMVVFKISENSSQIKNILKQKTHLDNNQ